MEKKSKSRGSSPDHADRFYKARDYLSDDTSSPSARRRNLIGMGRNPHQWSEQASTSGTSHSNPEKQPLLRENQELQDRVQPKDTLLNNIETTLIEKYKTRAGTTRQTLITVHNKIGVACQINGLYEGALFSYEIARALGSETGHKGYDSCLNAAIDARNARYHIEQEQGVQLENGLLSSIEQSIVDGYREHLKSDEDAEEIKGVLNKIGERYHENRQHREALFFYNAALALNRLYSDYGRLRERPWKEHLQTRKIARLHTVSK